MRARAALLALCAALLGSAWPAARALEDTATPTTVMTTNPASCTVEARPLSFLETLVEEPTPDVTPVPITAVPEGGPVDDTTRAEVTATVTMLIACVNAGDLLRAFALYDDGYLRRIYDPDGKMPTNIAHEIVQSFATPEPVAGEKQTTLVGLPVIRKLADGRVAVVSETNGGVQDEDDETELDLLILARTDGRWLIVDGRTGLARDELPAS